MFTALACKLTEILANCAEYSAAFPDPTPNVLFISLFLRSKYVAFSANFSVLAANFSFNPTWVSNPRLIPTIPAANLLLTSVF